MPSRQLVARELSDVFKLMAHPDRIRLIEELRDREMDVNTLAEALGLPAARVSQHLGLLRASRLVQEQRAGRRRLYYLSQPEIAAWIVEGIDFIERRAKEADLESIHDARRLWAADEVRARRSG